MRWGLIYSTPVWGWVSELTRNMSDGGLSYKEKSWCEHGNFKAGCNFEMPMS